MDLTTGSLIGFVGTVLFLLTFLAVSWWQLRRIDRTVRGDLEVGVTESDEADPADAGTGT